MKQFSLKAWRRYNPYWFKYVACCLSTLSREAAVLAEAFTPERSTLGCGFYQAKAGLSLWAEIHTNPAKWGSSGDRYILRKSQLDAVPHSSTFPLQLNFAFFDLWTNQPLSWHPLYIHLRKIQHFQLSQVKDSYQCTRSLWCYSSYFVHVWGNRGFYRW